MNKNDLVNKVSDHTGLNKSDSAKAVDAVFDTITSELKGGGDIRLVGFGTFLVSKEKQQLEEIHKPELLSIFLLLMFQNLDLEKFKRITQLKKKSHLI